MEYTVLRTPEICRARENFPRISPNTAPSPQECTVQPKLMSDTGYHESRPVSFSFSYHSSSLSLFPSPYPHFLDCLFVVTFQKRKKIPHFVACQYCMPPTFKALTV
jgi:hypothetical protein